MWTELVLGMRLVKYIQIHVNSGGGRDGGRRDGRRKDEECDRGCSVMYVDGTSSGSQLLV